jgi:predicted N-acetyltransferase YhbS
VEVLDDWLKKRALQNEASDAARTYVVCVSNRVVGYYALATGSVNHETAIGRVKRNMPNPVPVMVLARLAIDQGWQGKGLGRGLLRDAILRTLQASEIAGIKAILVHAISDEAKAFHEKFGFQASLVEPMTLMVTLKDVQANLS